MPDTTVTEPASSTLLSDALHNPLLLASRRAELIQLATERASKLAAEARTRVEVARADATARVQELRKTSDTLLASALQRGLNLRTSVPASLRRVAHCQLLRTAEALQAVAKRLEPVEPAAPVEAPTELPPPAANA